MKALILTSVLFMSFVVHAQNAETSPKESPVDEPEDSSFQDESDSLLQENDELRAEVDRLQNECRCEEEQREEYVSERAEESPVVIINQIPPAPQPQQEVIPEVRAPAVEPQFNNSQYQNNSQFVLPGGDQPPPVNVLPQQNQK